MPQLSPVDQAFFLLETPARPMNVGVLMVLAPGRGSPERQADGLIERMLRCRVGPPFNYRLRPAAIARLYDLEVDERIDARRQIHRHRLRRTVGLEGLFRRICDTHVALLPRDEPLWQLHLYTGLEDRRVALYFKTHHGLIDGMGFLRVFNGMVSSSKAAGPPRAIWQGYGPESWHGDSGADSAGPPRNPLATISEAGRAAADLARLVWHQGLRGLGLGPGLAVPFVATPDVLRAPPSPKRALAHCSVPLRRVRAIARRGGAKINDVMMTAVDAAMSRYLEERGSRPSGPLVADVPVALAGRGAAGNSITILQVPMGRPGATPRERLEHVVRETQDMKHEVRALSGASVILYSVFGHTAASVFESLGLTSAPLLANVVISNPAGFEHRVRFNGWSVEMALPVSVIGHQQVLNVTITTYIDRLHLTWLAHAEAIPDLERLAAYALDAVDELETALRKVPHARRPGTRGTPARRPAAKRASAR
jgi:diacylglycerol O-acyltransferase